MIGLLLVLVLAMPVAAWWVIGDLSEIADPEYADYLVGPPDISHATEAIAGLIGLILVLGAVVIAVPRLRRQRQWLPAFVAVVAAGGLLAFAGRVVTAGVDGANIGGGLMLYFGGPTVLGLLLFATARSLQLSRQQMNDP